MAGKRLSKLLVPAAAFFLLLTAFAAAQETPRPKGPARPPRPDPEAELLRGAYGPYRANNDLLSYDLDIRVDPVAGTFGGKNTIRFRMLEDGTRIQLDLAADLKIERITAGGDALKYTRDHDAVFIDFPGTLKKGSVVSLDFYYSGSASGGRRWGGISFRTDPAGRPWITTSCQGAGAMTWWPNKEQQRDEVENMRLRVSIPDGLMDISNGRLTAKVPLGDGYTRWEWSIHYPINNYCVALNIGNYVHFAEKLGGLTLDYYCLPENLDKARAQFAQARPMIQCFERYFGPYPFIKDGYKLVEVPYAGMEHQSAVAYGNRFANGYLERDWTGVGISPRFDFIIIHESAHEWFGNSVTAADVCDEWIHEGWGTYMEALYVEHMYGKADALRYVNGYRGKVRNMEPVIGPPGVNYRAPQDMYFKGALFINTLRSVFDDDARWWKTLRKFYDRFKYRTISTEDVIGFFNAAAGRDLRKIFDQYLRKTSIPALELKFDGTAGTVAYRWKADVEGFDMPVKVGRPGHWLKIGPTTEWKSMKTDLKKDEFEAALDLYYIDLAKE